MNLFSWRDPISYIYAVCLLLVIGRICWPFFNSIFSSKPPFEEKPIELKTVADGLYATSDGYFRDSFTNKVKSMVDQPVPITGDNDTTCSVTIKFHNTVMAQVEEKMLKIQDFEIPDNAQQLSAVSKESSYPPGYDDANVWVFVKNEKGEYSKLPDNNSHRIFKIERNYHGRIVYIVALYNFGLFSKGKLDFAGAEISDLAGKVENFKFVIGGDLSKNIKFGDIYSLHGKSRYSFYKYKQVAVKDLPNSYNMVISEFGNFMEYFKSQSKNEIQDESQEVNKMWEKILKEKKEGNWAGFNLLNISDDVVFIVNGERTKS
jgi:hypothetical protein